MILPIFSLCSHEGGIQRRFRWKIVEIKAIQSHFLPAYKGQALQLSPVMSRWEGMCAALLAQQMQRDAGGLGYLANASGFSPVSFTEAYPKLAPYRPPGQLISPPLLLSIILNVCFTIIMQTCGFLLVKQQPWYVPLASQR